MKLRFWSDAGSDVTEIPPARTFENARAPEPIGWTLVGLALWCVLLGGLYVVARWW